MAYPRQTRESMKGTQPRGKAYGTAAWSSGQYQGQFLCGESAKHVELRGVLKKPAATAHSALVNMLLDLGAVLYATTNVPQILMIADSANNIFGRTLNPKQYQTHSR